MSALCSPGPRMTPKEPGQMTEGMEDMGTHCWGATVQQLYPGLWWKGPYLIGARDA